MGFFERIRPLTNHERSLAHTVFQNFLPYDDIQVGDHTGIGGAPWTEYQYIDEIVGERFTLHMGTYGYSDLTSAATIPHFGVVCNVFIHELTHVWQGAHGVLHGAYQLSSLLSQGWALVTTGDRGAAYEYKAGQDWSSYNVEQQANIVEDWFRNGRQTSHPNYRYIREDVRKP
jgi:hypothetical protein